MSEDGEAPQKLQGDRYWEKLREEKEKKLKEEIEAKRQEELDEVKRLREGQRIEEEKLASASEVGTIDNSEQFQKTLNAWQERQGHVAFAAEVDAHTKSTGNALQQDGKAQDAASKESEQHSSSRSWDGKVRADGKKFNMEAAKAALAKKNYIYKPPSAPSKVRDPGATKEVQQLKSQLQSVASPPSLSASKKTTTRFQTPVKPVHFNPKDADLKRLFDQIKGHPETQSKVALTGEVKERSGGNALILSRNTSFCAEKDQPLVKVDSAKKGKEDSRVVYNISPDEEGPIYMPRKNGNGKSVKDKSGKIVYDILYYKPKGNGFTLDLDKSFISPDNVPEGSYSSAEQDIRDKLLQHHGKRFAQGKGRVQEKPTLMLHSNVKVAKAHVIGNAQYVPPAPPLPPPGWRKGNGKK